MNTESSQLTLQEKQLVAPRQEPSVGMMLQTIIDNGITESSIAAFEKLVALKERMDDKAAEREFATDFLALKKALPPIKATKPVMNKDGHSIRFTFAPIEEIDSKLAPVALEHGFTYAFAEGESQPGRVTKICIVTHRGGFSRQHKFTCRIGSGPPGSSESQSDGAAHSYAKRGALCDAFGIVIDKEADPTDDDANIIGKPVTQEQADILREMCDETNSDRKKFLAHAGSATFEEIPESRFDDLVATLNRKGRSK